MIVEGFGGGLPAEGLAWSAVERGGDGAELTSEERVRYERLLGTCAGNENLFAERRHEAAARERLGRLTNEAKKAALPLRPKYEEPGAVVLPAFVFEWLKISRDASWTVVDVGVLAVVLGMFANRDASIINGARFEEDDGDDVLVVSEDVIFRPDATPTRCRAEPGT